MNNKKIFILCFVVLTVLCAFSFAAADDAESPAAGSWMLESVYENASGGDKTVLDPESSASLYAETANVYSFTSDGSVEVLTLEAGEIFPQEGMTWDEKDGVIRTYFEENVDMELTYDPETDTLHRYWKDEDPGAMYLDLDFTYVRLPIGDWQMKYVVSTEPGQDPVQLDPENAGALYSESTNVYSILPFGTASALLPEDFVNQGTWELKDHELVITFEDGDVMTLKYDSPADTLHRYWKDETPDAAYHDLDFVYLRKPEK